MSSEEILRVVEAAESGKCPDCARLENEIEGKRKELHETLSELHRAHVQIHALEGMIAIVRSDVRELSERVTALTSATPSV